MARPEIEHPELVERPRLPPGVLAVLILGVIGVVLFAMRDCDRAPPPVAMAPLAETNAPAPPPAPEPVAVATETNRDEVALAAARVAFERYSRLVHAGDFWAASNALREVNAKLTTVDLQTNFWQVALPDAERATLSLASICLACPDGHCGACSGKGLCTTCDGSGICTQCEGKSVRFSRCAACRCEICRGGGRCVTCVGEGVVRCATCGGSGKAGSPSRVTCVLCDGTGQRRGLRRANGEASKMPCLTCRGVGYRESSRLSVCATCAGKGRVACASCGATGRCSICVGRGQTQPCQVCGSTGQLRIECPRCRGAGTCEECQGTKRCAACGGDGACPTCAGRGMVRTLSLPVAASWLAQVQGYVVVDGQTGMRLGVDSGTGPQAPQIRGRKLTFTVEPAEMLWISTDGNLARARAVLAP